MARYGDSFVAALCFFGKPVTSLLLRAINIGPVLDRGVAVPFSQQESEELEKLFQSGDDNAVLEAFDAATLKMEDVTRSFLLRKFNGFHLQDADIRDAMQIGFLNAFEKRKDYRAKRSKFHTWVNMKCVFAVLTMVRRRRRRREQDDFPMDIIEGSGPVDDEALLWLVFSEVVSAALDTLSKRDQIIVYHEWREWFLEQGIQPPEGSKFVCWEKSLAELLNCKKNTASRAKGRAFERLFDAIDSLGGAELLHAFMEQLR